MCKNIKNLIKSLIIFNRKMKEFGIFGRAIKYKLQRATITKSWKDKSSLKIKINLSNRNRMNMKD